MTKIFYIFDQTDRESRMEVARAAQVKGYEVILGLIGAQGDIRQENGFKVIPLSVSDGKIGMVSSLRMVWVLRKVIQLVNPDIVHVVTLKFSFMAGLASLFLRGRKVYTLAGLGYLFRSDEAKSTWLRFALSPFLKFVFLKPYAKLIFQNVDDLDLFVEKGYGKRESCILIRGSGVYLDRFDPNVRQDKGAAPVVLMPTRLVHEKGVTVFVEAARILKKRGVNAHFKIAGGETNNPKAISKVEMLDMVKDGATEWLGRVDDLPDRLAGATLIVYPSYYGEGIPRVLLEACAAGRAIVTTDHPGCREAVAHDKNGLLVPVKDAIATADAMERILGDATLRKGMEIQSRKRAEDQFDIHLVAEQTVGVYDSSNKALS